MVTGQSGIVPICRGSCSRGVLQTISVGCVHGRESTQTPSPATEVHRLRPDPARGLGGLPLGRIGREGEEEGLGKSGWVVLEYGPKERADHDQVRDWILESYCAVAPKKLAAEVE